MTVAAVTHADIAAEMQAIVRSAAGRREAGDQVGALIRRAARALGLRYWRAHDFWYGRARRIEAHEADTLRLRERALAERRLREMEADYEALRARLAADHPHLARLCPPALEAAPNHPRR